MIRLLVFLALCGAAAGCASYETGFFAFGDGALAPRGPGAKVTLYRGEPDRAHREIGEVLAVGGSLSDLEELREALIRKAASVGADAVKQVRVVSGWEDYGYADAGPLFFGPYGCWWGWSYPVYSGGVRATVAVRGIAIVWRDEAPRQ